MGCFKPRLGPDFETTNIRRLLTFCQLRARLDSIHRKSLPNNIPNPRHLAILLFSPQCHAADPTWMLTSYHQEYLLHFYMFLSNIFYRQTTSVEINSWIKMPIDSQGFLHQLIPALPVVALVNSSGRFAGSLPNHQKNILETRRTKYKIFTLNCRSDRCYPMAFHVLSAARQLNLLNNQSKFPLFQGVSLLMHIKPPRVGLILTFWFRPLTWRQIQVTAGGPVYVTEPPWRCHSTLGAILALTSPIFCLKDMPKPSGCFLPFRYHSLRNTEVSNFVNTPSKHQ